MWRLPYTTHCYLLPLLSQCLPLEDEICKLSPNFIRKCLCNNSRLGSAIANYGVFYGHYDSFLGHNALLCVNEYNVKICDIVNGSTNVNYAVNRHVTELMEDHQFQKVIFLRELILLRDKEFVPSNDVYFSCEELEHRICNICND